MTFVSCLDAFQLFYSGINSLWNLPPVLLLNSVIAVCLFFVHSFIKSRLNNRNTFSV